MAEEEEFIPPEWQEPTSDNEWQISSIPSVLQNTQVLPIPEINPVLFEPHVDINSEHESDSANSATISHANEEDGSTSDMSFSEENQAIISDVDEYFTGDEGEDDRESIYHDVQLEDKPESEAEGEDQAEVEAEPHDYIDEEEFEAEAQEYIDEEEELREEFEDEDGDNRQQVLYHYIIS